MAEQVNKKYTDEARYKRGIDRILKSDQYTDEYKKVLMDQLGNDYNIPQAPVSEDMSFDLLKSGSIQITTSEDTGSLINVSDKPAAVTGYLEKPTYLQDELQKAVDTDVDELIKLPPKQKPLTVPKETYDDLRIVYNQSIVDLEDLRDALNLKISELETANQNINLLNQTVDSEKLLRSAANNETQSANERYIAVLQDFQTALQKGIQEAIERVSLTAQVRGLQAQKEVLQQQLEQMAVIVKNLQQSVEQTVDELGQQQEAAAAQFLLGGVPGTFYKAAEWGWKFPDASVGTVAPGYPLHYHKGKGWRHGATIDFYNLSDEEELILTFDYVKVERRDVKGSGTNKPFMGGPTRITVPKREGTEPGKVPVTFEKVQVYNSRWSKIGKAYDDVNITASIGGGDKTTIPAHYRAHRK